MLSEDDLADVEGDASALLRLAQLEDDERVDVIKLSLSVMKSRPMRSKSGPEACRVRVEDEWRPVVRSYVPAPRARWLVCHELAEHHLITRGYRGEDIEARCDALGAALVLPRRLAQLAIREHGHAIARLARVLDVTRALALLRVGEVEGLPVLLERRPGVRLARGEPFVWPQAEARPRGVVKVPLPDERRVGWMRRSL